MSQLEANLGQLVAARLVAARLVAARLVAARLVAASLVAASQPASSPLQPELARIRARQGLPVISRSGD